MSKKPKVVVYGASGYTGKLIAEFLAADGVPFVAAGRNAERLEAEMAGVPGLKHGDYEIHAVSHEAGALSALFRGRSVVINVAGPFMQLGEPVVQAALAEGCHYLDTTGEQDWVMFLRERYANDFEAAGRVLCPANAFMWTAGQLAIETLLETPGIDSFDLVYAPNGPATIASTLSFLRMCTHPQYILANNVLQTWPEASVIQVSVPHTHEILRGLPWGGGCEPIWYQHDPRVRNVRVCVAFPNSQFGDWIIARMQEFARLAPGLTPRQAEELTNSWGRAVAHTPPREIEDVNRCVVSCRARGRLAGRNLALYATSPYLQTGVLGATAARDLLAGRQRRVGFTSPAAAFGHRVLINALHSAGLHGAVNDRATEREPAKPRGKVAAMS
jgi:short subunit dehydrogenase-like uncharacterized protein